MGRIKDVGTLEGCSVGNVWRGINKNGYVKGKRGVDIEEGIGELK